MRWGSRCPCDLSKPMPLSKNKRQVKSDIKSDARFNKKRLSNLSVRCCESVSWRCWAWDKQYKRTPHHCFLYFCYPSLFLVFLWWLNMAASNHLMLAVEWWQNLRSAWLKGSGDPLLYSSHKRAAKGGQTKVVLCCLPHHNLNDSTVFRPRSKDSQKEHACSLTYQNCAEMKRVGHFFHRCRKMSSWSWVFRWPQATRYMQKELTKIELQSGDRTLQQCVVRCSGQWK